MKKYSIPGSGFLTMLMISFAILGSSCMHMMPAGHTPAPSAKRHSESRGEGLRLSMEVSPSEAGNPIHLVVRVLDESDGKPIAGAGIRISAQQSGHPEIAPLTPTLTESTMWSYEATIAFPQSGNYLLSAVLESIPDRPLSTPLSVETIHEIRTGSSASRGGMNGSSTTMWLMGGVIMTAMMMSMIWR